MKENNEAQQFICKQHKDASATETTQKKLRTVSYLNKWIKIVEKYHK